MRELLVATMNKGKVPGIQLGLKGLPFQIISLLDLPESREVEETANSFEGNAIIKAMTYAMRTGKLTLADDSGVKVDALNGRPGVRSARYVPGTDEDRYRKVLEEMKDVPDEKRTGRYVDMIAICDPEQGYRVMTFRGECECMVLREPSGTKGFGYDPIFRINELGKTFGECELEELEGIGHRSRALAKAREILLKEFV